MGTSVFVFYICAFGFYLWIRISKTLDLGQYVPYGVFVLFVECMGATTVILYGTNLLWNPVNEIVLQESEDGIGPGKLKVMMQSYSRSKTHSCLTKASQCALHSGMTSRATSASLLSSELPLCLLKDGGLSV